MALKKNQRLSILWEFRNGQLHWAKKIIDFQQGAFSSPIFSFLEIYGTPKIRQNPLKRL